MIYNMISLWQATHAGTLGQGLGYYINSQLGIPELKGSDTTSILSMGAARPHGATGTRKYFVRSIVGETSVFYPPGCYVYPK